jgi:hypothetical protein
VAGAVGPAPRASTRGAEGAMGDGNAPVRAGISGDGVDLAGGRALADEGAAADVAGAVAGREAAGDAVVAGAVDGGVPREATAVVAGAVVGREAIAGVDVDRGD